MKLNRKWILVIALLMSVAMATAGTLAYLTDRDSEANVFTIGNVEIDLNEEFDPDNAVLIPGVDIEKKPTITNTGKNDAWVWATIAIPAGLDNDDASKNVVHFNYTEESVAEGLWNWKADGNWMVKTETIDEVEYNVYTVLYDTILKPGETTAEPVMTKVYMDPHVDIDPEGNMAHVEGGVVTDLGWNVNDNGEPIIYVSAYAIQATGFETALDAYNAYTAQWGDNGTEYGTPDKEIDSEIPVFIPDTSWADNADTSWYTENATEYTISTAEQLAGLAVKVNQDKVTFKGKTVKLGANIDLGEHLWVPIGQTGATEFKGVFDGNDKVISNMYIDSSDETGAYYSSGLFGWVESHGSERVTIKNVVVDRAYVTGHHNVAVIAGYIYGYIDNCTVTNSTVICTHANDDACGDKAGIIAGYAGDGAFTNNSAKNCTVTASRDAGQMFGCVIASQMKNHVGNSAENVTVEAEANSECAKHNTNIKNDIFGRY